MKPLLSDIGLQGHPYKILLRGVWFMFADKYEHDM